jgi:hypothetical protein
MSGITQAEWDRQLALVLADQRCDVPYAERLVTAQHGPRPSENGQYPPGWEPLKRTSARWLNKERRVRDDHGGWYAKYAKVLAHTGPYSQFAYGTDTPSDWPVPKRQLQTAMICSIGSRVIGADVDFLADFAGTRTGQLIGPGDALTRRNEDHFHIVIDARSVPDGDWPRQGPIPGADIKSNGFIPWPGSVHWSGDRYEPVVHENGKGRIVPATPELITAINADLADERARRKAEWGSSGGGGGNGGGGNGNGHDGEVAATVLSNILRGLTKEQCYAEWLQVAIPHDPDDPFTYDDFERHYGDETTGAVAAARRIREEGRMPPEHAAFAAQAEAASAVICAEAEAVYARWLHDTDPVPTRIVLAAYVANMALEGDPVWVMLVGGSGIGKTERITPVTSMPHVVMASTVTGEAALLSASPKRERAKNATGGLLRQIGDRGVLVVKDFTSVLSMSRDQRAQVLAAMREIFDGRWDRHYGTDGGQVLSWAGKCGFITGCTTAIDKAHTVLDAMGTRFLFVRLPDANSSEIGRSALAQVGQEAAMRAELVKATTGLLGSLGSPHELHQDVQNWLIPLAAMAAQARSPVMRDYSGEIELVGDAEAPTRIIKQLGQLWRACGMLGLDEARSWQAVRRAGLDSIPKLRRAVITCLGECQRDPWGRPIKEPQWQPTTAVARAVRHPSRTTRRTLEDLAAHGIAERQDERYGDERVTYSWALSEQALTWWNALCR